MALFNARFRTTLNVSDPPSEQVCTGKGLSLGLQSLHLLPWLALDPVEKLWRKYLNVLEVKDSSEWENFNSTDPWTSKLQCKAEQHVFFLYKQNIEILVYLNFLLRQHHKHNLGCRVVTNKFFVLFFYILSALWWTNLSNVLWLFLTIFPSGRGKLSD